MALTKKCSIAGVNRQVGKNSSTRAAPPGADLQRQDLDETRAIDLMLLHPTLIKRPLADSGESVLIGFSEADYASLKA